MAQEPLLHYGFKEWAVVCEALATGRQNLLIRKGGISEENGEFRPQHSRFWMLRTQFHQSHHQIHPEHHDLIDQLTPPENTSHFHLTEWAEVQSVEWLDSENQLSELLKQTIYAPEVLTQRFHYRNPGLYVLKVEIHTVSPCVVVPAPPDWQGCKTWVQLAPE